MRTTLYIILLTVFSSQLFGQQDFKIISVYSSIDLTHFDKFISVDNSKPLKKISYYLDRKYSPNKNYYATTNQRTGSLIIKNANGDLIKEIFEASIDNRLTWLNDCIIIDQYYDERNKKLIIDLRTKKVKKIMSNGIFRFVGQNYSLSFYLSETEYSEIDSLFLLSRQSLISINENGVKIVYKNPTVKGKEIRKSNITGEDELVYIYSDSIITFDYYNGQLSTGLQSIGHTIGKRYFKNYDSLWIFPERVDYFDRDRNAKYDNGYTYALINNQYIYRFGENEITKILDCEDLKIKGFEIDNNFLIFNTKIQDKNKMIGVMNMDTKEIKYPKILEK